MKGYRFYLEYGSSQDKRRGDDAGNVIAAALGEGNRPLVHWADGLDGPHGNVVCGCYGEGFAAVYDWPDSPVQWTGFSFDVLRDTCKRISEQTARDIHPRLFERLDDEA